MEALARQDKASVVMKAYKNACEQFGLSDAEKARVLGVSRSTLLRNTQGFSLSSKTFELQVAVIHMFRSLYALLGGDTVLMREWFNDYNQHLHGVPRDLCQQLTGLVHINDYLDAMRGKV